MPLLDTKIFEILFLLCFGVSWPFSIYRTYKSRSNKGKSLMFMCFVFVGYMFGICNKIFVHPDYVIYFYIANALMVATDIFGYFRNKRLAAKEASA